MSDVILLPRISEHIPFMHRVSKPAHRDKPIDPRSRQHAKTWTADEERVLLQGRLQRMPYKDIGMKLGKTDLACRLHYHQMVITKKTPHTQPGRSIVYLSSEHPPEIHHLGRPIFPSTNSLSQPYVAPQTPSSSSGVLSAEDGQSLTTFDSQHSATLIPGAFSESGASDTLSPTDRLRTDHQASADMRDLKDTYRQHATTFLANLTAQYSEAFQLTASELEQILLGAQRRMSNRALSVPGQRQLQRQPTSIEDTAARCSVQALLNNG